MLESFCFSSYCASVYIFKEIIFEWFLMSGLALLHCHADFHVVLLKIKYQQGRHGNERRARRPRCFWPP